jgi:hypothetical protein
MDFGGKSYACAMIAHAPRLPVANREASLARRRSVMRRRQTSALFGSWPKARAVGPPNSHLNNELVEGWGSDSFVTLWPRQGRHCAPPVSLWLRLLHQQEQVVHEQLPRLSRVAAAALDHLLLLELEDLLLHSVLDQQSEDARRALLACDDPRGATAHRFAQSCLPGACLGKNGLLRILTSKHRALFAPRRWTRPTACASIPGWSAGSSRMATLASVNVSPESRHVFPQFNFTFWLS